MRCRVVDDLQAALDRALPALPLRALDPAEAEARISPLVPPGVACDPPQRLREIRVTRHQPGRRCLIRYEFDSGVSVYGKMRARGADARTHHLLVALRNAGFRRDGGAPAMVPEPLGVVDDFGMTLQREVLGPIVTEQIRGNEGVALMARVARAIHGLHRSPVPTHRRHTLADEMQILTERLRAVAGGRPGWRARIDRVAEACANEAAGLPAGRATGIHRDFYPDQLIVVGPQLALLDLDLYAVGDPALDVGNFIGHITEQALRCEGDPRALIDREEALEARYLELAGEVRRETLRTYATLTLARHIQISTRIRERRHLTPEILELCEARLGLRNSASVAMSRDATAFPHAD